MRATSSAFKTRRRTVKVDNFTAPTVPQCPLNSVNAVVLSLMAMGAVVTVHGTVPYSLRTLLFYPLIPYIYIRNNISFLLLISSSVSVIFTEVSLEVVLLNV